MNEQLRADVDDDAPPTAADALAIIRREQRRSDPNISPFFLVWGGFWLVIGVGWFVAGQGGISAAVAGLLTGATLLVGCAVSAVLGIRLGRGVSGPSSSAGRMFGVTWALAMIGTGVLVAGLSRFTELGVGVLAPAMFVFVAGVLYSAGGAVWRSRADFALGIAVQLVAIASVFTPVPWNSLVMGVAGGGAVIAMGAWRRVRWNRGQHA